MACPLGSENVWVEKHRYDEAEKNYFVHLAKLLNGCPKKPNKIAVKEIETKTDNKETSMEKTETTQNTTAPPLTDTKKEKEKKNKRINNKTSSMKGGNGNTTIETQQTAVAAVGSPKKAVEVPIDDKDESSKAQTAAKAKKDRWRNRRKNNSRKDEENAEKTNGHTPNGTKAKGENNPHDEKKVNTGTNPCTLVSEIAKARQHIKNSLERMDGIAALAAASPGGDVLQRLAALESNASALQKTLTETQNHIKSLESRIAELTISKPSSQNGKAPAKATVADDDDGVDLFASDSEEEDEASAKVREQRLAEYAAKKSKKPVLIAKSSLVLDIKPWDDETDLTVMEAEVRKIVSDGLLWGASKFVPVAFGIKKLSISCVVEDEKVSIDWLTEEIEKFEDFVQSVDVAAFNKI